MARRSRARSRTWTRMSVRQPCGSVRWGPRIPGPSSRSLIHLDPSTLHDVVERIGGNPQFAVELVEHWLQSSALERTEEGFRTRASARRLTPLSIPGRPGPSGSATV